MKQDQTSLYEMAEQVRKNYEQALRCGVKAQEEMLAQWQQSLAQVSLAQQWQKQFTQFTNLTNGSRTSAQMLAADVQNLVQKSTQANTELMKKALEAAQSTFTNDSRTKWMEFWQLSLAAVQSNNQALMQMNTRAMDYWMHLARQNGN